MHTKIKDNITTWAMRPTKTQLFGVAFAEANKSFATHSGRNGGMLMQRRLPPSCFFRSFPPPLPPFVVPTYTPECEETVSLVMMLLTSFWPYLPTNGVQRTNLKTTIAPTKRQYISFSWTGEEPYEAVQQSNRGSLGGRFKKMVKSNSKVSLVRCNF